MKKGVLGTLGITKSVFLGIANKMVLMKSGIVGDFLNNMVNKSRVVIEPRIADMPHISMPYI